MKKGKFLTVCLASAITLMGAGYAMWNENVTVNNTAETGEIKVVFAQDGDRPYAKDPYNNPAVVNGSATRSQDNKTLTVQLNNIFPGANGQGVFAASMQNQGNIPVKFDKVTVKDNGTDSVLAPKLWYWVGLQLVRDNDSDPTNAIPWANNQVAWSATSLSGTGLGNMQATLTNLFNQMNAAGITLKPGDMLRFDIPDEDKIAANVPVDGNSMYFGLHESLGNEYQEKTAKFDIKVDWKQFNQ